MPRPRGALTPEAGTWGDGAGLLEMLDFASAELCAPQWRYCVFHTEELARVNGLSTWVWVETAARGRGSARGATAFPYGVDALASEADRVDFSSRAGEARATAWRNVFIPLAATVEVLGDLEVETKVQGLDTLAPWYEFRVSVNGALVAERVIRNLYPTYHEA